MLVSFVIGKHEIDSDLRDIKLTARIVMRIFIQIKLSCGGVVFSE